MLYNSIETPRKGKPLEGAGRKTIGLALKQHVRAAWLPKGATKDVGLMTRSSAPGSGFFVDEEEL